MRFHHAQIVATCIAALLANVSGAEFFHTDGAWALLVHGGVRVWGDRDRGGDASRVQERISFGVRKVVATESAFAALKEDGSVISWGKESAGGDSSNANLHDVVKVVASAHAFAALRADGGVSVWGSLETRQADEDSEGDESDGLERLDVTLDTIRSVVDVIPSSNAFAFLKEEGDRKDQVIYTWDGNSMHKVYEGRNSHSKVVAVVGGLSSFAGLKADGSVFTWGDPNFGGDSSAVRMHLQSGVLSLEQRSIFDRGFVAWKANSTAVIWGHNTQGVPLKSQILRARQVQLRHSAGAVLRTDGSAFSFGDPETFGDSSQVDLQNIKSILCPRVACAGIKSDGSLVTWGQNLGQEPPKLSNVREIFGTPYSFAALIPGEYDSIVTWGDRKSGGHIDYPKKFPDHLDVRAIHSHFEGSRNGVFIAEVGDGLYAWGDPRYGALVSSEIKQRRLQNLWTTCFTDAIPMAAREDVMNSAGDCYPLGILSGDSHNAEIVSFVIKIVIEEVFGYNTVWQDGYQVIEGIAAVAGCADPWSYPHDQTDCSGGTTRSHVMSNVELEWNNETLHNITAIDPQKAPVVTNKMYRPFNGLYVSGHVYDAKSDAPRLDTKEAYQVDPDTQMSYAYTYFSSIYDFNQINRTLKNCTDVDVWEHVDAMDHYVWITGDVSGVNYEGKAECFDNHWWLSPGNCRFTYGVECVPLITGFGVGIEEVMQKAAIWQLGIAIADALDWIAYMELPMSKDCLFYWWEPDPTHVHLNAKMIKFPPFDRHQWYERGNWSTQDKLEFVENLVSYDLKDLAPEVYNFMHHFKLNIPAFRSIQNIATTNDVGLEDAVCTWMRLNESDWLELRPITTTTASNTTTETTTTTTVTTSTSSTDTSTTSPPETETTSSSVSSTLSMTTTSITSSVTSTVTGTTSTSSSVTVTGTTSTSSSVTSTRTTVTTSSITSSSSTFTVSSSTTMTSSSSTTSSTLLQSIVVPSSVDATEPDGSVIVATLQSALAAVNSKEDSVVVETETGNVTVVKLSISSSNTSSLVFEISPSGGQQADGAIKVALPLSVVGLVKEGGNAMLVVNSIKEEVARSFSAAGESENDKVILSAPIIDISLIQEVSGEVEVANVSSLEEPIIFRLHEDSPTDGDACVFFDLATKSWSTKGLSVANESQIEQMTGTLSNGTWCAATHLSLFSVVQTIPFDKIFEVQDDLLSSTNYMVAVALMLGVLVPVCLMFCTWACFRVQAPAGGKTKIKDDRGRSHVVKFTRSEIVAKEDAVAKEKTWRSSRSEKDKTTKVLVTWDVQHDEVMRNLDHMKGHGWVDMDIHSRPAVTEKKSLKDLPGLSREVTTVSTELRRASQEEDRMEELAYQDDGVPVEAGASILEVSVDEPPRKVMEMYEDHEHVNYWSNTHQMLMQAFISGKASWDENDDPYYNVLVGPRKQLREQVSHRLLSPAFRESEPVFYDEGDGKKRRWRKAVVVQNVHAKAIVQVTKIDDIEGDLEQTTSVIDGDELKKIDVPFERICRRYVKEHSIFVYLGHSEGWQSATVDEVEDFTDEFSPTEVEAVKVRLQAGGDPVLMEACRIQNSKDDLLLI